MKSLIVVALALLAPSLAFGRAVKHPSMTTLIERSTHVFVGRVKTITPSGIKTTMSYPTWKGITFEWLICDAEVVEPLKGAKKGETVRVAMLSAPDGGLTFNPPGMVDPEIGKAYLLCLAPTTLSHTFAAVTAPWDDNQAIFVLDRDFWLYSNYRKNGPSAIDGRMNANDTIRRRAQERNERHQVLWSLVDDRCDLTPGGAAKMRQTYRDAINNRPPADFVIHLQWETFTSPSGWQWDVPKGGRTNSAAKAKRDGGEAP